MTLTLNVVLPQAPGFNAGMAAVDLGLISAARKLLLDVVPWRIGALCDKALSAEPELDLRMEMGLGPCRRIEGEWPSGVEGPIIYWGDFHHMAQYVRAVGRVIGGSSGGALARRYLLLEGVDTHHVARSATFGTTLIFNNAEDFSDDLYVSALKRLVGGNVGSWFRDPISTIHVRRLASGNTVETGVDPALVVDPDEIPRRETRDGSVGLFLGRSSSAHPALERVAGRISRALTLPVEWVDWGDTRGFPALAAHAEWPIAEVGLRTAMHSLSHLASCSAVVTDSYHLSLISWRLGIPAITVSAPFSNVERSVNSGAKWSWRDKRELAGSQYGALDFVMRTEELEDENLLIERTEHIVELIQSNALSGHVQRQIEHDVNLSLRRLEACLPQLAS